MASDYATLSLCCVSRDAAGELCQSVMTAKYNVSVSDNVVDIHDVHKSDVPDFVDIVVRYGWVAVDEARIAQTNHRIDRED